MHPLIRLFNPSLVDFCPPLLPRLVRATLVSHPQPSILLRLTPSKILPPGPAATSGPCSASNITIAITSTSDISGRQQYGNTVTVTLEFYNNLTLTSALILDGAYACTILQPSANVTGPIWITAASDAFYPFMINSTSNILVQKVNFHIPFNGSPGYHPPV